MHCPLRSLAAALVLSCLAGSAVADSFEFHQRIKGLVKSEPAPPPPPPCVDPRSQNNGTISNEFCGHVGTQLLKTASLLFEMSGRGRSQWANACPDAVVPSRTEMKSAMFYARSSFKIDYNYWTRDSFDSTQAYVVLVRSNGVTSEGWSSKSSSFDTRCGYAF